MAEFDQELPDHVEVIFQDEWLVAINKPTSLLVHPGDQATDKITCMSLLRDQLGQWVYPIHRLDRKTSGVIIFGLNSDVARKAGPLFASREVRKTYWAVTRGWTEEQGFIDYPLKDVDRNEVVREAQTAYQRIATVEWPEPCGRYQTGRFSLVAASPHTGRTHQIRRHLKHLDHPILGDRVYGDGVQNRYFEEHFQCDRMLLHSCTIEFVHPFTEAELSISAPLEHRFATLNSKLGWPTDHSPRPNA